MYLSVFLCLSGYVHLLVRENTFIILMYHMHNTDNLHCSNSIVVAFSTTIDTEPEPQKRYAYTTQVRNTYILCKYKLSVYTTYIVFCWIVGPVTPSPIFLFSLSETLLTIWMTILMLEVPILVPISQYLGPKLDHFSILNFPSLFSDWSIQKFLETNSKNFWINQSEKR